MRKTSTAGTQAAGGESIPLLTVFCACFDGFATSSRYQTFNEFECSKVYPVLQHFLVPPFFGGWWDLNPDNLPTKIRHHSDANVNRGNGNERCWGDGTYIKVTPRREADAWKLMMAHVSG